MVSGLVFDLESFFQITNCNIQDEWFNSYELPNDLRAVKRSVIANTIYFLDSKLSSESPRLILIDLSGPNPIFRRDEIDRYTFDRIATIVRSVFTSTVSIPYGWHPHHLVGSSIQSVYAAHRNIGSGARIHFDSNPAGTTDLLFFERTEVPIELEKIKTPDGFYLNARLNLSDAIKAPQERKTTSSAATGINLSQRLPQLFSRGTSLDQWYSTKLTDEQREFVDKPYTGPVRLRGAAGTGKTLSLAVKFLRDGRNFERSGKTKRFCFLTHSSATVDLVNGICFDLDPLGLILGGGKCVTLQVRTLYDLAFEYLRFDLDKLAPLSLDGRLGRQLQTELIGEVLDGIRRGIDLARYSDVSEHIKIGWGDLKKPEGERLVNSIMNEFASVLDADGVWAGTEKGEKYAKGVGSYRPVWLMELPTEIDRRFILEVHRQYRKLLAEMQTLSVDQMVADFNSFLDRNTWDQLRKTKGFDAIFVDELHLFTSIERQVLHKLVRPSSDEEGAPSRPAVFMAYDIKQSPRDTFTESSEKDAKMFSASTQLQNSDLVKLSKIFRYTPEIAEFLYDLDAMFPAIDLAGEWEQMAAVSEVADGTKPTLSVYKDESELLRVIFDTAISHAKRLTGSRRAAILCVNESLFDQYDGIARQRFKGNLIHLNSREPNLDLRHAGKKVVFSMPEYVAGLQFDTVFLIHVDAADSRKDMNIGERRRLISSIYLGASRAERELHIACCESRGGPATDLSMALDRKSLQRVR